MVKTAFFMELSQTVIYPITGGRNDPSLPIFTDFYRYHKTSPPRFAYFGKLLRVFGQL